SKDKEIESKDKKIDDLKSQIGEKEREIKQIQRKKENAEKEAQNSRQAADAKQAEIDRLGRVNQELDRELTGIKLTKQQEIAQLESEKQGLNQQLAGIQSANQQELTAKQQKIAELESEKDALNQQLTEAKATLERANTENQQAIARLESENKELTREKEDASKICRELEDEYQKIEVAKGELKKTIIDLRKDIGQKDSKIKKLEADIAKSKGSSEAPQMQLEFSLPPSPFGNQKPKTQPPQPQPQPQPQQAAARSATPSIAPPAPSATARPPQHPNNASNPLALYAQTFNSTSQQTQQQQPQPNNANSSLTRNVQNFSPTSQPPQQATMQSKQTPNAQQQQPQQQPQQQAAMRSATPSSAPQPAPSATAQPNLKQQIGLSSVTDTKPTPSQQQQQHQQLQSQPPQQQAQQQPQPQQPPKPANPATQATNLAVTKTNSVFTPIEVGTQKLYPVKLDGANLPDGITLVGSPNVGNKYEWYQQAYNCLLVEDIFRSFRSSPPPKELILTPAPEMGKRTNVCALNKETRQYHIYSVLWPKATLQYKKTDTSEVLSMDQLTVKSQPLSNNSTSASTASTASAASAASTASTAPTPNIYISSTNTLDSLFKVLSNKYKTDGYDNEYKKACVANFANPIMVGGYSRYGVQSQEQGLCVTTDLLPRLCSENIKTAYYDYNAFLLEQAKREKELNEQGKISEFNMDCNQRSDFSVYSRCIFTPDVSQLKDANQPCLGVFLDSPKTLNVITISAPSVDKLCKERLEALMKTHNYASNKEYHFCLQLYMQQWRIFLCTAYSKGMKHIVLGALGCGKFNGNPCIAAIALFTLLQNEGPTNDKDGNPITTDKFWKDCFDTIIIAISTQNPTEDPNYKAFKFYLDHFFKNKYNIC
ncbi:MAG: poly(ADP-ribose) glycohydrolase domain-containing protein, partial [Acutalibacteraceae bacterium]